MLRFIYGEKGWILRLEPRNKNLYAAHGFSKKIFKSEYADCIVGFIPYLKLGIATSILNYSTLRCYTEGLCKGRLAK